MVWKERNVDPYFIACKKINLKYIKNLNVMSKEIKLLAKNIEEYLPDFETGKDVLNKTQK